MLRNITQDSNRGSVVQGAQPVDALVPDHEQMVNIDAEVDVMADINLDAQIVSSSLNLSSLSKLSTFTPPIKSIMDSNLQIIIEEGEMMFFVPESKPNAPFHYYHAFEKLLERYETMKSDVGLRIKPKTKFNPVFPRLRFPVDNLGLDFDKLLTYDVNIETRNTIVDFIQAVEHARGFVVDDPQNLDYLREINVRVMHNDDEVRRMELWRDNIGYFILRDPVRFFSFFLPFLNTSKSIFALKDFYIGAESLILIEGNARMMNYIRRFPLVNKELTLYARSLIRDKIQVSSKDFSSMNEQILQVVQMPVNAYSELASAPGKLARISVKESLYKLFMPCGSRTVLSWNSNDNLTTKVENVFSALVTISLVPWAFMDEDTLRSLLSLLDKAFPQFVDTLSVCGFAPPVAGVVYLPNQDEEFAFGSDRPGFNSDRRENGNLFVFGRREWYLHPFIRSRQPDFPNRIEVDGNVYPLYDRGGDDNYNMILDIHEYDQSYFYKNMQIFQALLNGNFVGNRLVFQGAGDNRRGRAYNRNNALISLVDSVMESISEFHHAMVIQAHNLRFTTANYFTNPFYYNNDVFNPELLMPRMLMNGVRYTADVRFFQDDDDHGRPVNVIQHHAVFDIADMSALVLGLLPNSSIDNVSDLSYILTGLQHSIRFDETMRRIKTVFDLHRLSQGLKRRSEILDLALKSDNGEVFDKFVSKHLSIYKRHLIADVVDNGEVAYPFIEDSTCFECKCVDRAVFELSANPLNYGNINTDATGLWFRSRGILRVAAGSFHTTMQFGRIRLILPGIIDNNNALGAGPILTPNDLTQSFIQRDINIIGPQAVFLTYAGYRFKQVSFEEYQSWDFSSPIKFGRPGEVPVTCDEVVVPFCIVPSNRYMVEQNLMRVSQKFCFLWREGELETFFRTSEDMLNLGRTNVLRVISKAPLLVDTGEVFETYRRYI